MSLVGQLFYQNYRRGVFKDLNYIKIPSVRVEVATKLYKDGDIAKQVYEDAISN